MLRNFSFFFFFCFVAVGFDYWNFSFIVMTQIISYDLNDFIASNATIMNWQIFVQTEKLLLNYQEKIVEELLSTQMMHNA